MSKSIFHSAGPCVHTIAAGEDFLHLFAKGLKDELGENLSDALILLPNRRAARRLTEEFLNLSGGQAAILPLMRPLADIDPNEPPFEPGHLAQDLPPAIEASARRYLLASLLRQREKALRDILPDPVSALALADPLIALMDDIAAEELTAEQLSELDSLTEFAAVHFQDAAVFFKIVQDFWPQILRERGRTDPMARRVGMINALADEWITNPPDHPVFVAGSTGAVKATAHLMKVVAHLPKGCVVMPGLDLSLDDKVWTDITRRASGALQHPQAMMARLLTIIGTTREHVQPWPGQNRSGPQEARRALLAEALLPAETTSAWLERLKTLQDNLQAYYPGQEPVRVALHGLSLIEAPGPEIEAQAIALMMRETLEAPDKTAALITPDAILARRVQVHLNRWDINVDSSAGQPLSEETLAVFAAHILALAADPFDPVTLAAMVKSPHFALGQSRDDVLSIWAQIEAHRILRGPRLVHDGALSERLQKRGQDPVEAAVFLASIRAAMAALGDAQTQRTAPDWAQALAGVIETLTHMPESEPGDIWRGEAAVKISDILRDLIAHGAPLAEMDVSAFAMLLQSEFQRALMRPAYGTHPRLQILGPLEARLVQADRIILSGLNEGTWPAHGAQDMFLSRGTRTKMGLSLPERRYGLSAHDFAQLAAYPDVILTRAARDESAPSVASRWLWRLQTLAEGALGKDEMKEALRPDSPYLHWAAQLNSVAADQVRPAAPPAPAPPLDVRWPKRQLSVTQMTTLVRDPYSIYAGKILGLTALDPLDRPLGPAEFGTALHDGLETYYRHHHAKGRAVDTGALLEALRKGLIKAGMPERVLAEEDIRLRRAADFVAGWEAAHSAAGWTPVVLEGRGEYVTAGPAGAFTLTARADRIDESGRHMMIMDYKTGNMPGEKEVMAGFDLQMPLQALIMEEAGFADTYSGYHVKGHVADLVYLKVRGGRDPGDQRALLSGKWSRDECLDMAREGLAGLLDFFDNPDNPYLSQPRAKWVNKYGDYDHLARRREWAAAHDGDPS